MKKTTFKTTAMIAAAGLVTVTMLAGGSTVAARISEGRGKNTPNKFTPKITLDEAKQIALLDAGLNASDVYFDERECKLDDGEYDIEFTANGYEYEYEIRATDGAILDREIDD